MWVTDIVTSITSSIHRRVAVVAASKVFNGTRKYASNHLEMGERMVYDWNDFVSSFVQTVQHRTHCIWFRIIAKYSIFSPSFAAIIIIIVYGLPPSNLLNSSVEQHTVLFNSHPQVCACRTLCDVHCVVRYRVFYCVHCFNGQSIHISHLMATAVAL